MLHPVSEVLSLNAWFKVLTTAVVHIHSGQSS